MSDAGLAETERRFSLAHRRPGDGLLRLLGAQLLHGVVVFLLLLRHEDVLTSKVKGAQRETWLQPRAIMVIRVKNIFA